MKKATFVSLALALVLLINLTGLVSADSGDSGCEMFGMMSGSFGMGWRIFSWIISLLIIVTLVLFIVWLVKQIQKK